jgi:hypothetical protein
MTTVQELEKLAAQQRHFESKLSQQEKQIESLAAGLQKVSTRVEMSRPLPGIAVNSQ